MGGGNSGDKVSITRSRSSHLHYKGKNNETNRVQGSIMKNVNKRN